MSERYDVLAIGAHLDDMEVVMGGTLAKLTDAGHRVLLVDLCSGEPARPRTSRLERSLTPGFRSGTRCRRARL